MVAIRIHRRLLGALLDLSTVVSSMQLVLDNDTPVPLLQRIKALLAHYHAEIVGLT